MSRLPVGCKIRIFFSLSCNLDFLATIEIASKTSLFDPSSRVVSRSRVNHGSRWLTDYMEMHYKKSNTCVVLCAVVLFYLYAASSSFPLCFCSHRRTFSFKLAVIFFPVNPFLLLLFIHCFCIMLLDPFLLKRIRSFIDF